MRIIVSPNRKGPVIHPEIYGHFAEHLGRCVYEGLYVGENSDIPNINGMRTDVVQALKYLQIPVLRWPGGCFASEYHWQDGIGPRESRKTIVNNFWGGVTEDNSFGTHEFMELCRQLECKPYINMNVGSGTVQEMMDWVEYLTSDVQSPMTQLRGKNGRKEPWKVPYIGIGNENWGGGGTMRPEYYADEYRRYQTYVRGLGGNRPCRIACGAGAGVPDPGYGWTETLMKLAGPHMDGLSLHYYVISGDTWEDKGSATEFDEATYYKMLRRADYTDALLRGHEAIMDRYDPKGRIGLMFDEWGAWHAVEPGTQTGFLYQQNTMRDAQIAAITLNIFNRHSRRVRMANLAQLANVLQALLLTDGRQMIKTCTYHVFDLFRQHMGAEAVDIGTDNRYLESSEGLLPQISTSASVKDGKLHITLANAHARDEARISLRIDSASYAKASGRLLAGDIHAHNTFAAPDTVGLVPLEGICTKTEPLGTEVTFSLPPCSVAAVTFERQHATEHSK
ncbi:MAG TPA: alpha-L-arabinofuranosidase C-terminal domain-containing protein [Candidatus Limiplasma sp.]|nr:alpha-L-arabinofuranosidase C-terminal domain-containing protein [Candidatus Limiplasma sp.]